MPTLSATHTAPSPNLREYWALSERMTEAMGQAFDDIMTGRQTLTTFVFERRENEKGLKHDLLYTHLLQRLRMSGVQAQWSGEEGTSSIEVPLGLGLH